MNLPNKLTILRMALVPVFLLFFLWNAIPLHFLWALIVFSVAAATDAVDGHLARKYHLVTNFGKFLDPLADKILVFAALIVFIDFGYVSSVAVVIMMFREFLVTSLRLVAVEQGVVIAAGKLGKLKTAMTMAAIVTVLTLCTIQSLGLLTMLDTALISNILMWIAAVLTLLSGGEYLWSNRRLLSGGGN